MNSPGFQTQEPDEQPNLEKWMRFASALEVLKKMAKEEKDPVRQAMLYDGLGQEECIS